MIKIQLKMFATIAQYLPQYPDAFAVEEGTDIEMLISKLNIPISEVKLIFVNGRKASFDQLLKDGDRVGLFPPVGGG
ncbi:ThiamineS protein [Desulfamplus magnetovallimortis]|uniref:ThiamineS protein n=1 Tax=Desulfamplus magnetovallimortis TaxID=1246637 RepID=A0A1W1HC75_9BACT|nr:MoaD/ThiS family protein [Desulfamplus magnetovallimortis]SLM30043.1 ThiamineS protein [Desulfamplus magnetovallimortis]